MWLVAELETASFRSNTQVKANGPPIRNHVLSKRAGPPEVSGHLCLLSRYPVAAKFGFSGNQRFRCLPQLVCPTFAQGTLARSATFITAQRRSASSIAAQHAGEMDRIAVAIATVRWPSG